VELNDVEEVLAEAELVACLQATLPEAKQIRDACLADDIPVVLDRGACCGSSGCGCAPKIQVLARQEDLPVAPAASADEMPCPACGTAAPLVGGACTDCGLQLE
jgi:hypothetical protein